MNYTFRDICDLMNDMAETMGGNYRGAPEPRDQARQIDWAIKTISNHCKPVRPGVQFFLRENVSEYRLDNLADFAYRLLDPISVTVGGIRLASTLTSNGTQPSGVWSIAEAEAECVDWLTNATQREKAVLGGNNNIYIVPAPTSEMVDRGAHKVDAVVIPGWILSDGTYWPGGPPLGQDDAIVESGASSSTSVTDENAAGTAALHADSGTDGGVTNPNNAKVDDTSVATISQTFPMASEEPVMFALSDFGFSIPTGATVTSVRIKSLQASCADDLTLYVSFVEDTGSSVVAIATQTVALGSAGSLQEFGPLAVVPGIDYPVLNSSAFGVVLSLWAGTIALTGTRVGDFDEPLGTVTAGLDYLSIEVSYFTASSGAPVTVEGAWGTGGTTLAATDWNAIPDMPEYVHEAIAVLAAFKAANPVASDRNAVDAIGRLVPEAKAAIEEYRSRNAMGRGSIVVTRPRFRRRIGS